MLQAFTPLHVHNFFGIESHVDSPIEGLPGITMSKPGPLHPLVVALQVMPCDEMRSHVNHLEGNLKLNSDAQRAAARAG